MVDESPKRLEVDGATPSPREGMSPEKFEEWQREVGRRIADALSARSFRNDTRPAKPRVTTNMTSWFDNWGD